MGQVLNAVTLNVSSFQHGCPLLVMKHALVIKHAKFAESSTSSTPPPSNTACNRCTVGDPRGSDNPLAANEDVHASSCIINYLCGSKMKIR